MQYADLDELYQLPFFDLLERARATHRQHWPADKVQLCTLLSIKTGSCPEDCGYCSQSAHNKSGLKAEPLMSVDEVRAKAVSAKAAGAQRFCMGAGWRQPRNDAEFTQVLDMVRIVDDLGMEACVTLGMLNPDQARRLKEAGLTAYNHNLDTSPEYYDKVITTRTFADRVETLENVSAAGLQVCSGGILGMGETVTDRLRMIEVLSELDPAPESIPINRLVAIPGTPMEGREPIDTFDLIRVIAVTRVAVPTARIRLSAGREGLNEEAQALCFFAGANSVFYGDRLLTTDNQSRDADLRLLRRLDLVPVEEAATANS